MAYKLSYTTSQCPIDIEVLRRHANVDDPMDNDLIEARGIAATELVEEYLGRPLLQRTYTWTVSSEERGSHPLSGSAFGSNLHPLASATGWFEALRGWVALPRPANAVTSVKFVYWDGTERALVAGTDYQVDLASEPARIRLLTFPLVGGSISHLSVTFTGGYGTDADQIPKPILLAIMLLVTNMGENRGDKEFKLWTEAVEALLSPYGRAAFR